MVGLEWDELGGQVGSQCALGSAPARLLLRLHSARLAAPGGSGRRGTPRKRPALWAPSPPPRMIKGVGRHDRARRLQSYRPTAREHPGREPRVRPHAVLIGSELIYYEQVRVRVRYASYTHVWSSV